MERNETNDIWFDEANRDYLIFSPKKSDGIALQWKKETLYFRETLRLAGSKSRDFEDAHFDPMILWLFRSIPGVKVDLANPFGSNEIGGDGAPGEI